MDVKATFFRTPADFRKWLRKNSATAQELWVGFYKVGSGKPSITWPESVDEALCVGWIDGIRKSIDAGLTWTTVNSGITNLNGRFEMAISSVNTNGWPARSPSGITQCASIHSATR